MLFFKHLIATLAFECVQFAWVLYIGRAVNTARNIEHKCTCRCSSCNCLSAHRRIGSWGVAWAVHQQRCQQCEQYRQHIELLWFQLQMTKRAPSAVLMMIYTPWSRFHDSTADWKFEQAFTGGKKPKCICIYIIIHIYKNLLGRYTGISQQLAR